MLPETVLQRPDAAALVSFDASAVIAGKVEYGELTLEIDSAKNIEVCRYLREREGFVRLSSVTAVDWHPIDPRFEVVYHLHSLERNARLRLKCKVSGLAPSIRSVYPVWRAADWYEREVFDLFGIAFHGHPNLTRIMMPDDWEGHPLRKDYPVHGHKYDYRSE